MFDVKELLEGIGQQVSPPADAFEHLVTRRERRQRNRRIGAAAMALTIAIGAIGYLLIALQALDSTQPAEPGPGKITASNVGQLRVAWHAPDLGILPAISDGVAFVDQGNIGDASIRAYPLACRSDGGPCDATWAVDHFGWQNPAFVADGFVFQIGGPGHAPYVAAFATDCGVDGARCEPTWRGLLHPLNEDADIQYAQMGFSAGGGGVYVRLANRLYRFPIDCGQNNDTCSPTWVNREFRSVVSSGDHVFARSNTVISTYEADCFATNGSRCPEVWTAHPAGGAIADPMLVLGDELYVVADGLLQAYRVDCGTKGETCAPDWSAPADFSTQLPPVTDGRDIFLVSGGDVGVFDGSCQPVGGECAPTIASTTSDLILQSPAVADGLLFVSSLGKSRSTVSVYALGCAGCEPVFSWQTPGAGAVQTTLLLDGNTLLVVAGNELYALQPLPARRGSQPLAPMLVVPLLVVAGLILLWMLVRNRRRQFA